MHRSALFRTILLAAASFGAAHCATAGNVGELRARAAFDLTCSADSLQLQTLSERTYGVDGCGKRATYVWAYQNQSWILDSRSGSSAETSAAVASTIAPTPNGASASNAVSAPSAASGSSPSPASSAGPIRPAAAVAPPAAPAKPGQDPKACETAQDYRRRSSASSGAAQAQLLRMAERKEAECRAQKEP